MRRRATAFGRIGSVMMQARVKICGITSVRDAGVAFEEGAHAIGVLVGLDYDSPDQLECHQAAEIVRSMGALGATVLVTHRKTLDQVRRLYDAVRSSAIQLHAAFDLDQLHTLRDDYPHLKIIKAVHVESRDSIAVAESVTGAGPDGIVLDTRTTTRIGGTGVTHDWSISRAIVNRIGDSGTEVILAGGLRPENVVEAIRTVLPSAIDVNTGVKGPDGRAKSPEKIRRLVAAVRSVRLPRDPRA